MADKQPIVIVAIPATVLAQMTALVAQLEALAAPFLIPLTADQRKKRLKMGAKSVAFVTKAYQYALATPSYAPAFVSVSGLGSNLSTVSGLDPLAARISNLGYVLESTLMVASGSAKAGGLLIYDRIHEAADNNQANAQPAYNDLKTQFEYAKDEPPIAKP